MRQRSIVGFGFFFFVTAAVGACGSDRPPPSDATGSGGIPTGTGSSTPIEAGTLADGGGGSGGDGGGTTLPAGNCATPSLGAGVRMTTIAPTSFGRLDGVTPNVLTIAWTDLDGNVFVADRSAAGAHFGTPIQVGAGGVTLPAARAALTPDALTVIVVSANGTSLQSYSRSAVGQAIGGPSTTSLTTVNAFAANLSAQPLHPVVSASGTTLYFMLSPTLGPPRLYESKLAGGVWGDPTEHTETDLVSADGSHARRPTSASVDDKVLYFYDQSTNRERVAVRSATGGAFETFTELGPYPEAAMNGDCNLLFYQGTDANGAGIFNTSDGK